MGKPDYILHLEKDNQFFSSVVLKNFSEQPYSYFQNKKVDLVYSESELFDKINFRNLIFKTAQGFYIVCDKKDSWVLTIYYKQEQFKELQLLLNQLKKLITNDTTNN